MPVADEVTRSAARLALVIALPVAAVAGLLAFWALRGLSHRPAPDASPPAGAATGAPLALPARSLPAADATTCAVFIAHLPTTVRGRGARPITGGAEQNAGYGEPPIRIACGGVPVPSVAPDAQVWTLSGICWYAEQSGSGASTWTTLDRRVPVAITVPGGLAGAGGWVQEFSAPITAWVPSLAHPPAHCRQPATAPS
jgi:Protein of unknown function (DUF3515)